MWKPILQGPALISLEGAMQAAKEQMLVPDGKLWTRATAKKLFNV